MKIIKAISAAALLAISACTGDSEKSMSETNCTGLELTQLKLGDKVPTAAVITEISIMTSPSQFQPAWDYNECGIDYTLGVDSDGYVQYIGTRTKRFLFQDKIGIGTPYADVKRVTGNSAMYMRGYLHVIPISDGWNAGFALFDDELPDDSPVSILLKTSSSGYGKRPENQSSD